MCLPCRVAFSASSTRSFVSTVVSLPLAARSTGCRPINPSPKSGCRILQVVLMTCAASEAQIQSIGFTLVHSTNPQTKSRNLLLSNSVDSSLATPIVRRKRIYDRELQPDVITGRSSKCRRRLRKSSGIESLQRERQRRGESASPSLSSSKMSPRVLGK